jgi:hypothetical protein
MVIKLHKSIDRLLPFLCLRGISAYSFFLSLSISFLFLLSGTLNVAAQTYATNSTMDFQGKIVNKTTGTNLVTGTPACVVAGSGNDTCDFRVSIYTESSGGTLLWQEPHLNEEIGAYNGVFHLSLNSVCNSWTAPTGSCSGSGLVWGNDSTIYIEVEFAPGGAGSYTETFTRKLLTSVPYAYYSDSTNSLGGLAASAFVQLQPASVQTVNANSSNALIHLDYTGTGSPDLLDLKTNGTSAFKVLKNGNVEIGGDLGIGSSGFNIPVDVVGNIRLTGNLLSRTSGAGDITQALQNYITTQSGSKGRFSSVKLAADSSDNIYIFGAFFGTIDLNGDTATQTSTTGSSCVLAKYDSTGTLLWKTTPTSATNSCNVADVAVDASGNVIAVGVFTGMLNWGLGTWTATGTVGSGDFYAIKFSSSGVPTWAYRELAGSGNTSASAVAVDSSGDVAISGFVNSAAADIGAGLWTPSGSTDMFVLKLSSAGVYQWAVRETGTATVVANDVAVDSTGAVIAVGTATNNDFNIGAGTWTVANTNDYFVVKYNSAGVYQWADREDSNGAGNVQANTVAVDSSNAVIVGGVINSGTTAQLGAGSWTPSGNDYFVIKYNSAGTYQWADREDSGTSDFTVLSLATDGTNVLAGGYISNNSGSVGAGTWTPIGVTDYFVIKYNSAGTYQWADTTDSSSGVSNDDRVAGLAVLSSNRVLAGVSISNGYFDLGAGTSYSRGDITAVIYSSAGAYQSSFRTLASLGNATITKLMADAAGNVIIGGNYDGSIDFGNGVETTGVSDYFVVSYTESGGVNWFRDRVNGTGVVTLAGLDADSAGNVYAVGNFTGSVDIGAGSWTASSNDYFVIKIDTAGGFLWADREDSGTGQALATGVAVDTADNPVVVGYISGTVDIGAGSWASSGQDYFVIKYNSAGTYQWADREDSGTGGARGVSVDTDSANAVVVLGVFESNSIDVGAGSWSVGGFADYFVVKYNSAGAYQWADREDSGTGTVRPNALVVDSSDNVIAGGYFQTAAVDFGAGSWTPSGDDYFIIKYNSAGTYQWADREDSGTGRGQISDIKTDSADNVYAIGIIQLTAVNIGAGNWTDTNFIIKYNSAGTYQYAARDVLSTSLAITPADGIIIGGLIQGYYNFGLGVGYGFQDFVALQYEEGYIGSDIGTSINPFARSFVQTYYGKDLSINNFDVAEEYEVSDNSIAAGDVVRFQEGTDNSLLIERAGGPGREYDSKAIGVISTAPGLYLKDWKANKASGRPVALKGRVPVKVSDENGPIKRGDLLTPASTPGYAMKATKGGLVIGRALEDFDPQKLGAQGDSQAVKTKINHDRLLGAELAADNLPEDQAEAAVAIVDEQIRIEAAAAGKGRIMAFVGLNTISDASFTTTKVAPLEVVRGNSETLASLDAALGNYFSIIDGQGVLLDKNLAVTGDLKVTAGISAQEILRVVSNGLEILNSVGEKLFAVDINSKISVLEAEGSSLGSATINASETKVLVKAEQISTESQVMLSLRGGLVDYKLGEILPGEGFEIMLAAPADADLVFDYLIIN